MLLINAAMVFEVGALLREPDLKRTLDVLADYGQVLECLVVDYWVLILTEIFVKHLNEALK